MINRLSSSKSFTLIELLVVIGILAILTAAVILVVNPVEYLKQSRDVVRMNDLGSIDKSLSVLEAQGVTDFGDADTVYVSIPDSELDCANLGLPSLPEGYSYACATTANLQKVDGTGWIPVDFASSPTLSLTALPIDPVNTTSTANYYTYTPGGSWELTTAMESVKYKSGGESDRTSTDGGQYADLYEVGSNKTLLPIDYVSISPPEEEEPTPVTRGLGLWYKMDEGSGNNLTDSSGNSYTGITSAAAQWVDEVLNFDGTYNISTTVVPNKIVGSDEFTAILVIYQTTAQAHLANGTIEFNDVGGISAINGYDAYVDTLYFDWRSSGPGRLSAATPVGYNDAWHALILHVDLTNQTIYIDGTIAAQQATPHIGGIPTAVETTLKLMLNGGTFWNGKLASALFYNVALSPGELVQMRAYLKASLASRVTLP